jgi:hypothetical protein
MEAAQAKTMIVTGVAQIVANIDADYLAEKIEEFANTGQHVGVIEIDHKTYINPSHIVTFGDAAEAPKPGKEIEVPSHFPTGLMPDGQ